MQYEPKYWWWEVLVIFKKMLLTGAISIVAPGNPLQIVVAILIVIINLLLTLKFAPFEDQTDDCLAFMTSVQMFLTLFGGLLLVMNNAESPQFESDGMGTMMVAINSFAFVFFFLSLLALIPCIRKRINGKKTNDGSGDGGDGGDGGGDTKVYPADVDGEVVKNDELENTATKAWE